MRDRVGRLRVWLLGSAVFLLLVIAAYIGAAHYVRRRLFTRLPAQLGINVQSDANGYNACRSNASRTIFCVHAAKQLGYTNGKITLHDASVVLFGQKGDRRDRIYGDEFEYDEKDGVIRAPGVVQIYLQAAAAGAPAAGTAAAPGGPESAANGAKVVHVTTSDLVYLEKLGVASTNAPIEFQAGAMTGHGTGADYSSDSGLLTLHSAVSMSGMTSGRPVSVTAATAEFDERSQLAFLTHAQYDSQGRTVAADQATLHRRPDGTLARVEAQGNVTIRAKGATTGSQRADVVLNDASQPQSAVLDGGVLYTLDEPLRQVRGQANQATIAFDKQAKPQPEHVLLTGGVHMTERTRATEAAREPWSVRDLTAEKFDAEMARAGEDKVQLRDGEATGNAHLTLINNGSLASNSGAGRKELSADDLKGHLRDTGNTKQPPQLDTIVGRGHTVLRQLSADGVEQVSTGDTLDAKFRPEATKVRPAASGTAAARHGADDLGIESLASAVQQGHVTMMRHSPAKKSDAHDKVSHATAERAAYDGATDRLMLTGGVQMTDTGSVLWANQLALDRASGDSVATGAVKVDYVPDPAKTRNAKQQNAGLTHILADQAELEYATDIATFHGKPVRLWQGADQVQAPVIEVAQQQQRLIARSEAGTGWSGVVQTAQVHTVLTGKQEDAAGAQSSPAGKETTVKCGPGTVGAGKASAGAGAPQVVRIASGGLVYSGILGQADFTGGVLVDTVNATIHASQATAYVTQTSPNTVAAGSVAAIVPSLNGSVDRVVAAGQVAIERPGLEATGERLVYTTSDQVYLLTGTKDAPPRAVDAQGTTTAAALRVRNTCDASGSVSVEALGEIPGQPAQRVHTESRVRDERKKENGSQ